MIASMYVSSVCPSLSPITDSRFSVGTRIRSLSFMCREDMSLYTSDPGDGTPRNDGCVVRVFVTDRDFWGWKGFRTRVQVSGVTFTSSLLPIIKSEQFVPDIVSDVCLKRSVRFRLPHYLRQLFRRLQQRPESPFLRLTLLFVTDKTITPFVTDIHKW